MSWLIIIAIPLVLWAGLALLLRQGKRERVEVEAELARIASLPVAEAKAIALHLLQGTSHFERLPARGDFEGGSAPASVRELFSLFDRIERHEFWLDRDALAQPVRDSGFRKIGEDMEFTEIVVKDGDDRIYTSYGDRSEDDALDAAPSVWHKIIEVSGIPLASLKNAV